MNNSGGKNSITKSFHQTNIEILANHFSLLTSSDLTKHARLRSAILESISDGSWKSGDQIPPEQDIAAATGISLGTVQRALGNLAKDGTLNREHGRGTFVSETRRPVGELWQVRFLTDDAEKLLPVYPTIVDQRVIVTGGPWSDVLGHDSKGYLKITRLLNVDGKLTCLSWFIVNMSRFSALRRIDPGPKQSVNLRRILDEELGVQTAGVTQRVKIEKFPAEICKQISVEPNTTGMRIDAIGFGVDGAAHFFHRIWAPSANYELDMTQDERFRIS